MKRRFTIMILPVILMLGIGQLCYGGDGSSPVQLYLGLRGGGGLMLTHSQLNGLATSDGIKNISSNSYGPSAHAKGEILLGIRRFRIGYRFLYNFSTPSITSTGYFPYVDVSRNTTYFNGYRNDFFGHYLLLELAIINRPHFALVPGLAIGSFSGFRVDQDTHTAVWYSADMHHPFSIGTELNAEIKIKRCSIVMGPDYYLFTLQDRAHSDWHLYQHYIGFDLGLRVNLLK